MLNVAMSVCLFVAFLIDFIMRNVWVLSVLGDFYSVPDIPWTLNCGE